MIKEEDRKKKQNHIATTLSTKNYGGFLTRDQMRRSDFEPPNRGTIRPKKYYY